MRTFFYAILISATFVIAFFICLTAHAQPPLHSAPAVVDAHNHKVGTLLTQGLANLTWNVTTQVNKVPVEIGVNQSGFVDEITTGGFGLLFVWFPTDNCTGQGYLELGQGTDPFTDTPLNIIPVLQDATYVYGGTLYYAAPPYTQMAMNSYVAYHDPQQAPVAPGCQSIPPGNTNLETAIVGTVSEFDLSSLNLVPPFKVAE